MSIQSASNKITIKGTTLESIGHALAGGAAGAVTLAILYPLDTIKTRSATKSGRIPRLNDVMYDIIQLKHLDDYYRGLVTGLIETSLFHSVHFFFYSLLKNNWKQYHAKSPLDSMPAGQSLLRGSLAGLITQFITSPLQVIKSREQSSVDNENAYEVIKSIYHDDGISGYWRGFKASILLIINPAIVFYIYELLRKYLIKLNNNNNSIIIDFISGFLSKAIATIVTYPLVYVKMNLQAARKRDSRTYSDIQKSNFYNDNAKNIPPEIIPLKPPNNNYTANKYKNKYNSRNNNHIYNNNNNNNNEEYHQEEGKKEENNYKQFNDNNLLNSQQFYYNEYIKEEEINASMSQIIKKTIQENGITGLFEGSVPKILHASLTYGIMFSMEEKFVKYTFGLLLWILHYKRQYLSSN